VQISSVSANFKKLADYHSQEETKEEQGKEKELKEERPQRTTTEEKQK